MVAFLGRGGPLAAQNCCPLTVRRISAVTNAVKSASMLEKSGLFEPCEYGFDVYKRKLDYVNSRRRTSRG